jgi:FkbM family methyltransferase
MFETIHTHTIYTPPLGADAVVLDLGAYRGEFAQEMSARYGGTYYLVEANPLLAEALRVEGRFPVWHCAVAETEGPLPFHIAHNDTGSSLLTLPRASVYNCVLRETVQVPTRRLESLLTDIRAPRIDLLKMDIEGAEVMVLRSLSRPILRAIGQITVEFHSDPVFGFDLHREVEEVIRSLQRQGFLCLDFSGRARLDVLFVNRAIHRIPRLQRVLWQWQTTPPCWLSGMGHPLPPFLRSRIRQTLAWATGMRSRTRPVHQ